MSDFEKKIGESLVDDMLPPDERPKRSTNRRAMDGINHDKYDDAFWRRGGDAIDDLFPDTKGTERFEEDQWPKTKKPFVPARAHPTKSSYLREEYEGPGGYARKKLRDASADHPLLSMGGDVIIRTELLETIAVTLKDEVFDILEETDLAVTSTASKELCAFLRQWLLDHNHGWDKMVKKYKPIEEEK
jgi:hypothetical protein